MRKKAPTYVCTIDPMSLADAGRVDGIRRAIRHVNRQISPRGVAYRVALSPRSVKPQFRWKYDNKHRPKRVRMEDAAVADVYVKLVARHRRRSKSRKSAGR